MLTVETHQPAAEVAQVLGTYGTPHFVHSITRAQVLLASYAYEELDFELVDLVMSKQSTQEAALLGESNIIVRKHVASILLQHGVVLDEDGDLDATLDILETVLEAANWYNPEEIERVLAMDCDEEERLMELARVIKNPNNPHYTSLVQEVNTSFAKRISDIMLDGFHHEENMPEFDQEQVENIRLYKLFAGDVICFKLLHIGYQVGAMAESYLRRASSLISSRNNADAAKEIAGFMLFSRDGWRAPLKTWENVNQVLSLEMHELATLGVEVRRVLTEFDTYKAKTK